ncbi:ParA family protein [Paenibacillus thiaminolyticus]|uniref:nucleotide-binding protein n=1 Tax=Paenibacillus thiaminolyticus TaxID=49283 RepID=UPI002543724C|nr:ParA family protein [Paenibacillus thiaminolyticus]WII36675.1 ParA family protein [Paenibacillus thiaminolyticus]
MKAWNIVVAHPQERVLDAWTEYWRQSDYAGQLHLRMFTQADTLRRYLGLKPGIHMVVADPEVLQEMSEEEMDGILITVLSAEGRNDAFPLAHALEIPYQPLPQLFQSLIERCRMEYEGAAFGMESRSCMLLGISSLGGGAGKTTAALHLARHAAAKGKRVLLLNVDPVQEYALLDARPEPAAIAPLAQLLYYLRKDRAGESLPLESYLLGVPDLEGADIFAPADWMKEWKGIDGLLMRKLLRLLRQSGRHDLIIAEGGFSQPAFAALWEEANRIVWLLQDDLPHLHKTELLFRQWERSGDAAVRNRIRRLALLVNRYMGMMANRWMYRDAPITGYLPYIPSWKQMHRIDPWLQSAVYQSAVAEWADRQLLHRLASGYEVS